MIKSYAEMSPDQRFAYRMGYRVAYDERQARLDAAEADRKTQARALAKTSEAMRFHRDRADAAEAELKAETTRKRGYHAEMLKQERRAKAAEAVVGAAREICEQTEALDPRRPRNVSEVVERLEPKVAALDGLARSGDEQFCGRTDLGEHTPHSWRRKPDGSYGDYDDEGDILWCPGAAARSGDEQEKEQQ